jgi:hypothetical protein
MKLHRTAKNPSEPHTGLVLAHRPNPTTEPSSYVITEQVFIACPRCGFRTSMPLFQFKLRKGKLPRHCDVFMKKC